MPEPQAYDFDSMNSLVRNLPDSTIPPAPAQAWKPDSTTTPRVNLPNSHPQQPVNITQSKSRRSLASLARERTSTALANLTTRGTNPPPSLRNATSSGSLSQRNTASVPSSRPELPRSPSTPSQLPSAKPSVRRTSGVPSAALESSRQSGASDMSTEVANPGAQGGRTHQTSSKILPMTTEDRPITRDLNDLFATLISSCKLGAHRVRFSRINHTFSSEEAVSNFGALKFSQSNRIPEPGSPHKWVVTTTTTTFSMGREMARQTCQRFVDARLIESVESRSQTTFVPRGVWRMTPKGLSILKRFVLRNGVVAEHVKQLVAGEQMQLVTLERDPETDKINQERATMEIIFRRFMGKEGFNLKSTTTLSDSDSLSEYATGLVGVKMAKERRILDKIVPNTFTGRAASDWLLDCCTTVDRRETYEMAELFVKYELMATVIEDRGYIRTHPQATYFQPTKYAIYTVTQRGERMCDWHDRPPSISSEDSHDNSERRNRLPRDSNVARLNTILGDAALRLLFKEFLRTSLCEENLLFYLDVHDFTANYRSLEKSGRLNRPDSVRETLSTAYSLYNSFLAAGAPSELNIDHALRNRLDSRMIRTDNDDESMRQSLAEVVELYEQAQSAVFKLMASDSVPKFIRQPQYASVLRDHDFDASVGNRAMSPAPQRTLSQRNVRN